MNICSKKDIKFITGIMAASVLLGGCTANINTNSNVLKEDPNAKTSINLNEVTTTDFDQDEMDKLYREYCFNILSQTVKDYGSEDNVMISPASIMMALDMVAAGAKGESLDQLTNLFAAGKGPLTQQAYASALMDKINEAEDVEFSCANAVWANKTLLGNVVNLDYVQYIQDTFNADYRVQEFGDKTVNEINGWVDDHTDHMIKEYDIEDHPELNHDDDIPVIPARLFRAPEINIYDYVMGSLHVERLPHVPHFQKHDIFATCPGDAMAPRICRGYLMALRRMPKDATIINGEIYVVDTASQGMFLRRIIDNGDTLRFVAENQTEFPDFELPFSDVINVFRVVGVLIPNI